MTDNKAGAITRAEAAKVVDAVLDALQDGVDIGRSAHVAHSFAHLLQGQALVLLKLAFGDVARHPVGADELVAAVEAAGVEGKMAHVELYVGAG